MTRPGRLRLPALALAAVFASSTGCGPDRAVEQVEQLEQDDTATVVVSVAPLADLARRVLGDEARVVTLLPPAANPATFEPSMTTMAELDRAALVLRVGHRHFPLESTWLTLSRAGDGGRTVVDCVDGGEGEDAHLWWDPTAARACVERLAAAWTRTRPEGAGAVRARLDALAERLQRSDDDARRRLTPYRDRTFLVFHPAWGRFAARYGLRQLAVESHGHEPNAAHLAETIEAARAAGVRRIYAQPQFSPRGATLVAEEIGAATATLDPLADDWFAGFDAAVSALVEGFRLEDGGA